MYDPVSRQIVIDRDVKFNESDFQSKGDQPIRTERIDVYHNFQKDFDTLFPEIETEGEVEPLKQHEETTEYTQPVGGNDRIRK